jgi:inorganic triphosphatase YgiF
MFRRFRNPALQSNPLGPIQLRTLNQANQLVAGGQPSQAAPLYAELAAELEATNHPRRAANLHAQAAHAFADSQNGQAALTHARAALALFLQYQMVRRTPVFYVNITRKLNNKGMKNEAEALEKEFGSRVGPMPAPVAPPAGLHGLLPTNCPKCGAPIHEKEANWIDTSTVECDFCGSLIRPE